MERIKGVDQQKTADKSDTKMTPAQQDKHFASLRGEIDSIDAQIHDLLIKRTEVVEKLVMHKSPPYFRPDREASLMRKRLGQHRGRLPAAVIARVWREFISALIYLQAPYSVAVYAPETAPSGRHSEGGYWDLARDHFGSHVPLIAFDNASAVAKAVNDGRATLGIVPQPEQGDQDEWWRWLLVSRDDMPAAVAKIPFYGETNGRSIPTPALVIGKIECQPTGEDLSLLALHLKTTVSRAKLNDLFDKINLPMLRYGFQKEEDSIGTGGQGEAFIVLEVAAFLSMQDKRIAELQAALDDVLLDLRVIGAYARPIDFIAEG